jgi:hypothetical protein
MQSYHSGVTRANAGGMALVDESVIEHLEAYKDALEKGRGALKPFLKLAID